MTMHDIETDRLKLVLPAASHLPAYVAYCDSARSRYVGGPYAPAKAFEKFCAMAGHWTMRGFGRFVLTLKASGQPIGHVGALQFDVSELPDLTWTLWDGAFEGQGFAYEAVKSYLDHPQSAPGSGTFLIRIEEDNQRSLKLAHRIGAERENTAQPPKCMPKAITYRLKRHPSVQAG